MSNNKNITENLYFINHSNKPNNYILDFKDLFFIKFLEESGEKNLPSNQKLAELTTSTIFNLIIKYNFDKFKNIYNKSILDDSKRVFNSIILDFIRNKNIDLFKVRYKKLMKTLET
jgi:hypothetical protein